MWTCYGRELAYTGLLKLVYDCLLFTTPVILKHLLLSIQHGGSRQAGLALASALALSAAVQTLLVNAYFHAVFRLCARVKSGLIDMLYRKSLRISCGAREGFGPGVVNNLQSNDAAKLVIGFAPAFAGFAVTVAILPLAAVLGTWMTGIRKKAIGVTDQRVKLVTEILAGIKAIKLYAWEEPYRTLIDDELYWIRRAAMLEIGSWMLWTGAPILIMIAAFMSFTLVGSSLTAGIAFPALALFNLLRFPIAMFPSQITDLINGAVALRRIQGFVDAEEVDLDFGAGRAAEDGEESKELGEDSIDQPSAPLAIELQEASFAWHRDAPPLLSDVSLAIPRGGLVIVVGPVGCGKSSLLAALLGEMALLRGAGAVRGSLAYHAQDPWIRNASLRGNVTMTDPEAPDLTRYARVLEACALAPDVAQLPAGDETEIGEKGVNLSGGQRHRVALARACYADRDIYLLDDPLSAVDAHVGKHLFSECICGLLGNKTRVLVTHQLQYLPAADQVLVLEGGRIAAQGTHAELVEAGIDFRGFETVDEPVEGEAAPESSPLSAGSLDAPSLAIHAAPRTLSGTSARLSPRALSGQLSPRVASRQSSLTGDGALTEPLLAGDEGGPRTPRSAALDAAADAGRTMIVEEGRAVGRVQRSLYAHYFRCWGDRWYSLPIAMLVLYTLSEGFQAAQNWWLSVWSAAGQDPGNPHGSLWYLAVYSGMGGLSLVIQLVLGYVAAVGALRAARVMQHDLLAHVLRLPMSFYDTTPMGRLISRFSRDVEAVDVQLPEAVSSFISCLTSVLWGMLLVVIVTPVMALAYIPLGLTYARVQKQFVAASRELKRLDSVALSPIYSHFLETLAGLPTVRAFRQQGAFGQLNWKLLDASNRAWWPSQVINRWLSVRLELLGTGVVFGAAVFASAVQAVPAGLAGLSITAAMQVTDMLSWMVRMSTEMEINMNAVERLTEYLTVDTEAAAIIPDHRPPPGWPTEALENLVVRYRAVLPPVLHGISVGIVGRTGCGKSTLVLALYRLVEPCGGRVLLDGIDTARIGLRDLRSRLTLVPQDPVIFSGTIRSNLNPFASGRRDEELWEALDQAGLGDAVRALPGLLEAPISPGGDNLSQGQRQLLALARALVRRTRVLVLDEATSNVDTVTDATVQRAIAAAFSKCTVLTIAHRLHTIMGADSLLVLDKGHVAEFGSPGALLARQGSLFRGLAEEHRAIFNLPADQACRALGVSLTVLKRVCRRLGIERWPFRRVKSLERIIEQTTSKAGPKTAEILSSPDLLSSTVAQRDVKLLLTWARDGWINTLAPGSAQTSPRSPPGPQKRPSPPPSGPGSDDTCVRTSADAEEVAWRAGAARAVLPRAQGFHPVGQRASSRDGSPGQHTAEPTRPPRTDQLQELLACILTEVGRAQPAQAPADPTLVLMQLLQGASVAQMAPPGAPSHPFAARLEQLWPMLGAVGASLGSGPLPGQAPRGLRL
ncbi:hypothetical protein QBZ16_005057 [Prototheca wickerhamii]|uniref:Uncharacterized protein n=1 Tax=Prototheca wickerhamii TaxID=3111 RepID=A0AAD9MMF3_PROWI|nr:hypothetical protein QBZ16_005057 [Prototheca wickerhamii]